VLTVPCKSNWELTPFYWRIKAAQSVPARNHPASAWRHPSSRQCSVEACGAHDVPVCLAMATRGCPCPNLLSSVPLWRMIRVIAACYICMNCKQHRPGQQGVRIVRVPGADFGSMDNADHWVRVKSAPVTISTLTAPPPPLPPVPSGRDFRRSCMTLLARAHLQ